MQLIPKTYNGYKNEYYIKQYANSKIILKELGVSVMRTMPQTDPCQRETEMYEIMRLVGQNDNALLGKQNKKSEINLGKTRLMVDVEGRYSAPLFLN